MKRPLFCNNNIKKVIMISVVEAITDTNVGGAGRLLLNRIKNSNNNEFKYTVLLPRGSALIPLLKDANIDFFEIDGAYDKSFDIKGCFEFYEALKILKPDIINAHGALDARIAGKFAGVAVKLYTRHCDFPTSGAYRLSLVKKLVSCGTDFLSDGIIAVSYSARNNLVRLGIDFKKINVIINGVEPIKRISDNDKKILRSKLNIPTDSHVISIFARLEKYKDHETFLLAARELLKSRDCYFLIVGSGSEKEYLKSLAYKLKIFEKVRFLGFVKDVSPYMNITDINVNCSIGTETSSLALSEGMSLGIPAIVSDYLGNTYMVHDGENGLIYHQRDYRSLAHKMDLLLGDDNLYSILSDGAKKRYYKELNAKRMSRLTENYYVDMLKKKGYLT